MTPALSSPTTWRPCLAYTAVGALTTFVLYLTGG